MGAFSAIACHPQSHFLGQPGLSAAHAQPSQLCELGDGASGSRRCCSYQKLYPKPQVPIHLIGGDLFLFMLGLISLGSQQHNHRVCCFLKLYVRGSLTIRSRVRSLRPQECSLLPHQPSLLPGFPPFRQLGSVSLLSLHRLRSWSLM